MRAWSIVVIIAGTALLTCTTRGNESGTVVRDSAGVRVVDNPHEVIDRWRISAEPTVRIGATLETDDVLFRVAGALMLEDGRIVVANAGTHEIRFFDNHGAFISKVGGLGDGPGEFRVMSSIGRHTSDSVWAYDEGLRRLTLIDLNGTVGRTAFLPMHEEASYPHGIAGMTSDGSVVMHTWLRTDPAYEVDVGIFRARELVLRYAPDGVIEKVGVFSGSESAMGIQPDGMRVALGPAPFRRTTTFHMTGDQLLVFATDKYEFKAFSLDSTLTTLVRRLHTPIVLTAQHTDAHRRGWANSYGTDPRIHAGRLETISRVPYPSTLPAYKSVRLDALGAIWVQEYSVGENTVTGWTVFDPDGHTLASVDVPSNLRLTDVGTRRVVGITTDSLDVEIIEVFELEKN